MSKTVVPRVLVVGGTGHYGQHIVRGLAQRGATVRVLSRNAASARSLLGEAPDIVEGDITSKTARRTALQGMDALVIAVSAMAPALIRETEAIEEDAILITFCLVWPFYAFSETSRLPGLLGNIGVLLLAAFAVWQLWPVSRPAAIMIAPVAVWITIATATILDGARRYG